MKSKFEEYTLEQRISDLEDILKIQCHDENWQCSEYMRGMANGLLLAWSIIAEPYGKDVPFKKHEELQDLQ